MANVAPTQTVLAVTTATLEDSVPLSPDPDHAGARMAWHDVVTGDVSAGFIFPNTGRELLLVRSVNTGEITVVVDCPNACDQGYTTEHDFTAHVAAGNVTTKYLGPLQFPTARWSAGTTFGSGTLAVTDHVKFTVSAYTGVQVTVIKAPIV